jgi:flagellar basal body rod protein FlgG
MAAFFSATIESGEPILIGANGIVGSSLEASNVDIADEFSKLIVTQQALCCWNKSCNNRRRDAAGGSSDSQLKHDARQVNLASLMPL